MFKGSINIVALLAITLLCNSAFAAAIWGTDASSALTGSRSTGNGVTATAPWDQNGGFQVSWNITDNQDGTWTYVYDINTTQNVNQVKDISHFLLEVTEDNQPFDILGGTSTPTEGPQTWAEQQGNPGLPNNLYGVKFDFGATNGLVTYTIVTNRDPVWGVFYGKDGKLQGNDVIAYSDALSFADYKTNETLTIQDFIVRPDGVAVVPVPAAVWLMGSALIGLIGLGRKK